MTVGVAVAAILVGLATAATASPTSIDGIVTNAHTGEPIVDAQVIAHDHSGGWVTYTFTGADGHYELPELAPGTYLIEAMASGMHGQWLYGKEGYWDADPIASPGTADIALVPIEYGSLSGRFLTTSGASVPAAAVDLYTTDQNWRGSTTTDADGAFRFTGLETGDYRLRFTAPGGGVQWAHQKEEFQFYEADTFTVEANRETVVTETAFPTGSLEVTVVDADTAAPIAGAFVSRRDGPQLIGGRTDADGKLRLENIRTGVYSVSIAPPDGYLYGTIDDIVVVERQTAAVTGTLTKAAVFDVSIKDRRTGEPVSGACIAVLDDDGIVSESQHCSGADGKIRLDQWPAGEYQIYAYTIDNSLGAQWVGASGGTGDRRQAKVFTTAAGATTNVGIRLDPAGSITGTVRSANGNGVVERVCPSVTPVSAGSPTMLHTFCSQSDGTYTLTGLGPYRWPVQFPDFTGTHAWMWSGNAADRFSARPVTVRPKRSVTLDVTLPIAGRLTGTVRGATLPNEWITVLAVNTRTGDAAGPYATVTGEATYNLGGLATQEVWVDYDGGQGSDLTRHPTPVSVVVGRTTQLDLVETG